MTLPMSVAWSHGEESLRSRMTSYALDLSNRVSFASMFVHRLADDPGRMANVELLRARLRETVKQLNEADAARNEITLTVHQLIPGKLWQGSLGGIDPSELAKRLLEALSDARPPAGELHTLANELGALGNQLEVQAQQLSPQP